MDLDVSQKETRNASSELFKIKAAYEESVLQLDEVRRENKALSNEIKDIMDQISEGGHTIHEIDKIRKRLEAEKLELQSALEEAEATLEQEENKVLRAQLELNQVRAEIERRIAEKEEEFMLIKKAQSKGIESMQGALETESKGKAEALRMKEKLENLSWLLSMPMLALWKLREPSRSTRCKSEMPRSRLMMNLVPVLLPLMLRSLLTARLLLLRMPLKRPGLCSNKPIASAALWNKNLLTPTRLSLSCPIKTRPLLLPRGSWNLS